MNNKKIAVLLPVYFKDSPVYLRICLDSLKKQSYSLFDIYILVDGKIGKELVDVINDYPVQKCFFEKNRGIAYVLNDGIRLVLSKGYTYLARMDADDICYETRFEKQIDYLEKNLEVDCLGTWINEVDDDNRVFFTKKMPASHKECFELFKKRDCLNHPTVIFRNSYFKKAGFYPENTYFAEDTIFWANGFKNGCIFANLQETLLNFRLNKDFFERRRGWKHSKSILLVRFRVNKMLNYSFVAYIYAIGYALVKLLPNFLLRVAYKFFR